MSKLPQRSLRLTAQNASSLNQVSGNSGELFYDSTNQTLRLFPGNIQGGLPLATRSWTQQQITAAVANISTVGNIYGTDSSLIIDVDTGVIAGTDLYISNISANNIEVTNDIQADDILANNLFADRVTTDEIRGTSYVTVGVGENPVLWAFGNREGEENNPVLFLASPADVAHSIDEADNPAVEPSLRIMSENSVMICNNFDGSDPGNTFDFRNQYLYFPGVDPDMYQIGEGEGGLEIRSETNVFITTDGNDTPFSWIFQDDGLLQWPNIGPTDGAAIRFRLQAPLTARGAEGDKIGTIAFSSDYLYYCYGNYTNGVAAIWSRVLLDDSDWN